jgi:LysM repeat protein
MRPAGSLAQRVCAACVEKQPPAPVSHFVQPVLCFAAMGSVRRSSWKQYLIYLLLNAAISAFVVLLVLNIWDGRGREAESTPTPTVDVMALLASEVPTITATTAPTPTPVTYMVRAGDTLTDIALMYEVPIEKLMAANDLSNPDALEAGTTLIIPVEAPAEEADSSPPEDTAPLQSTDTPSAGAGSPSVSISGVEGAGNLDQETVRLQNSGGEVSMAGWTLDDGGDNVYVFPALTFYAPGAVEVHTREGPADTAIDLYWGLDQAVWTPGTMIYLRDADGIVRSTFQIPDME